MNILEAQNIMTAAFMAGDTVLMEGKHGIGKSQVVQQFAKLKNFYLVELFLSNQEVGDLIGTPDTIVGEDGEKITVWSKPSWLKRMEVASAMGQVCVLFLDELNRAPLDVRQAALQLVLENKIHEHELPVTGGQKTFIVAATNPADEYQVDEMDLALIDRFLFVPVEAHAPTYIEYGRKKNSEGIQNINPMVLDFIAEYPDRLHYTPAPETLKDGEVGIGTSPRSWAKMGKYLDNIEDIDTGLLFQIMKGKLGTHVASQFFTFVKNYVTVVKVQDVERVVDENKEELETLEELGDVVADLIVNTEAIQKMDLAKQLKAKAEETSEYFVLLTYLYSLDVEICVAFLKSFKQDSVKGYKNLAALDSELNNKELFKRIIIAADKK